MDKKPRRHPELDSGSSIDSRFRGNDSKEGMTKPTVLLDVDNTIFDREAVRKIEGKLIDANYGNGAGRRFRQIIEEVRKDVGWGDIKEASIRFARERGSSDYASALAVFLELPFSQYWRPHAKELVEYLAANFNLIIFSDGDDTFQKEKIEKLGLYKKAREVIISRSKIELFFGFSKKYHGKLIIIDDRPKVIEEAKRLLGNVITIWIKHGRHAQGYERVNADLETTDLKEVVQYLKSNHSKDY
ncbi:MAG: hypothetical protein ACD_57C00139G0003 [uncultured bacterium]|uniref:FCP1 homology domain-containing protein n=1 Tax=Candidatus Curtissbacteria bacterium RIFOXYA1_FULL_41_14 TaxID=1797737 RepID=A0A1F5HG50_9BACT|nr:MAG: hypothetical protein ACD_57C00139G0003 [uncultured bacterium]KKR57169.1 MAG: hypothetical protein UT95_C0025G0006 [Candidatus Curtissbacteria bacterium GW2011_GWB1_40_28]KKR60209.1 MAG: hypothetical protein UT99_C0017G0005 [Candidatus Curtissbacteria bacterium GW2011_GWA2_40_31]KKR61280.1 MAG: hypothetical protein UU00_C0018G0005 [Microgenomates group bacterium GW2011_GWC1_40_35]KKR64804.1 MAG: hypothetical protein UU05_C0039G0006 [Candidatus Curtissbacteria bacterium GW2011_GWA1_40_47]